jgi:hypothetical protein
MVASVFFYHLGIVWSQEQSFSNSISLYQDRYYFRVGSANFSRMKISGASPVIQKPVRA